MSNPINRRDFVKLAAGAGAGTALLGASAIAQPAGGRRRSLRIAHLTDIHVQPERAAAEGMAFALRQVQTEHKPDLILNGGDSLMDIWGADEARTRLQMKLFRDVLKAECSTEILHCVGNHDVGGVPDGPAGETWGKRYYVDQLSMPGRYHRHDRGNWTFIVLDSTFVNPGGGYTARLDDDQMAWLEAELYTLDNARPVIVLSHISVVSASSFFCDPKERSDGKNINVPGSWMHVDADRIRRAFEAHGNVRLALSGHMHMVDRIDYRGTSYICSGAVSGGWWGGTYHDFDCVYNVIDLFDDGSFETRIVPTGWKHRA